MDIRFDNRVAIVTGAGTGLGRSHALGLAARGARVMVNDLGVTTDGQGSSSAAAEAVAQEIRDAGGEAMAHGCDVSDEAGVKDMKLHSIHCLDQPDNVVEKQTRKAIRKTINTV